MICYRLVTPAQVDELLADWTKNCRSHNMILGSDSTDKNHCIVVHSSGRSCHLYIENPDGDNASETLTHYLENYCQRHPHTEITVIDDEKTLIARSHEEDSVGFITE